MNPEVKYRIETKQNWKTQQQQRECIDIKSINLQKSHTKSQFLSNRFFLLLPMCFSTLLFVSNFEYLSASKSVSEHSETPEKIATIVSKINLTKTSKTQNDANSISIHSQTPNLVSTFSENPYDSLLSSQFSTNANTTVVHSTTSTSSTLPTTTTPASTLGNNSLSGDTSEDGTLLKSTWVRVSLIVAFTVVFLAILIGNTILIAALGTNRETLTPTNIFVLNLAFSDLCVGVFCVYQNLSLYLLSEWIFSDVLCRMYHFVHVVSYTASVCIHVAIALERYLALVHPFWARVLLTRARLRAVIISVWLLSAVVCLPRFLIYKTITAHFYNYGPDGEVIGELRETLCVISHQLYNPKIYDAAYIGVCFALPLIIIGILYTRICLHLWRSGAHTARLSTGNYFATTTRAANIQNIPSQQPSTTSRPKVLSSQSVSSLMMEKMAARNSANTAQTYERTRSSVPSQVSTPRGSLKEPRSTKTIEVTASNQLGVPIVTKLASSSASMANVSQNGGGCGGTQIEKMLAQRRQVIKLMIALVFSFAVLSAPFHLRKLAQHFYPKYDVASNAATIATLATTLLLYFNSAMNPLLYLLFSPRVRALMTRVVIHPCSVCSRQYNHQNRNRGNNFLTTDVSPVIRRNSTITPTRPPSETQRVSPTEPSSVVQVDDASSDSRIPPGRNDNGIETRNREAPLDKITTNKNLNIALK